MPDEMGDDHCRHGTKVFCYEPDPEVVSVDHSGERYDSPEFASCLGSTSRRQMVNGGRTERIRALVSMDERSISCP